MPDIGAGSRVFAEAFAALGIAVTVIDVNADLLLAASDHVPSGRFLEAPAETLPSLEHRMKPETISAPAVSAGYSKTESVHPDHMDLYRLIPR
jgi:hypothetical protein